jgi:GNAT superfamily N-acetyltransferase
VSRVADPAAAANQAATVKRATEEDVPAMCRALALAFYDDPVAAWFMPDDQRRLRTLERGFEFVIRKMYLPHGECYTTDGLVGGALWNPPGTWRVGPLRQLLLLPGMIRVYRRGTPRALRGFDLIAREHPHERDHWYLPFMGVDPNWQGRGLGTALLRPVLDRCDEDGTPAYLESSTARNRACYLRQGFEDAGILRFPDGPEMTKMWREPGA